MDIQLQEFIDKIKKDGVEVAEVEATSIVNNAKAEAEKIIADAKMQAEKILTDAKAENERIVKSGEEAIKQAGRNLLISFRESVIKEVNAMLNAGANAVYSSDAFAGLIANVIECWAAKPETEDIAVFVNSNVLKDIENAIFAGFKNKIEKGVNLKASDSFDGGFRVSVDGGNAYYDYSTEEVVEMLSKYLSPKITKLLKEAE